MADENKGRRRWRAVFKNAVTWGVTWGALGSAVATVMRLNDKIPFGHAVMDGIGMGVRIGVVGALTGAAFSAFISVAYRGKRLAEISAARFGIGGAILGGLFVPAWIETMSILTGGGIVLLNLITDDFIFSAVFGGITAAGTMILAQRDEAKNPTTVQELLERMEQQTPTTYVGEGNRSGVPAYTNRERAHVADDQR
jgi:hypothetical protein